MPLLIVSDLAEDRKYWNANIKSFVIDYKDATPYYSAVVTVCNNVLTSSFVKAYPTTKVVNSTSEQSDYFFRKLNK